MSTNLSQHAPPPKALSLSLKARLGLGALLLGLVTLVTAGMMVVAMDRVSQRLDAALMAEKRVERYAALSTQVSTFIVIAAESIQTRMPPDDRALRLDTVTSNIMRTLTQIRQDLDNAVLEARALGIDEQSRRATQSLGIARMEAMFTSTRDGFLSDTQDPDRLQGFLDIFSISFDPLLNEVVVEEMRARQTILSGIETLRQRLTLIAAVVAAVTIILLLAYYFALIRPQFRRLDMLRDAAQRIGREDFAVALPDNKTDEIGRVFSETNRMAAALSDRKAEVAAEW
ncbi:MAG: sensor histidine kinase, partial [Thalassococcus sp.]|uniref:HAMP domain-containing protein n=1 Tax=Thalassococcus sp. TaxID=1928858 RepID=UPI001B0FFB2B|nr:sensor histidine kinase [Thalassococcus sp.]